ncbi:hypothetical protein, partial [Streptomyces sp. NPDC059712]|uniref:hypothetical protein n=1 Tax=Streptomyces sp. NPDC059712 TaxID=3346919 RepID=UPI0036768DF6
MAHASDGRSMEFKLPDLGEGLTEAEIVRWRVGVGVGVARAPPGGVGAIAAPHVRGGSRHRG